MPAGRTHLILELTLLVPGASLLIWHAWQGGISPGPLVAFVLGYVFSMLFLSPDLDLQTSSALRRWGPLRWIWIPYAKVFRHRQVSHNLVLGPLTRILYLVIVVVIVGTVILRLLGKPLPHMQVSAVLIGACVVGMFVPNLVHVVADRLSTAWRCRRRKRKL